MVATAPSSQSAPGLYLSNFSDIMAIWMASFRARTDTGGGGPRLGELHLMDGPASSRGVNHIVDSTGFFRDETLGALYVDAHQFQATASFGTDPAGAGILTTQYTTYGGNALSFGLRRNYAAVPHQPFLVIQYLVTNPGRAALVFNVLDQLHLANVAENDPARQVHAWYDSGRSALIADMSASGQFFVILGTFDAVDSFQVGNDANPSPTDVTSSAWAHFQSGGRLPNNADLRASDVDVAFQKKLTVGPGETASLSFYLTVRPTLADAFRASDTARTKPASGWLTATAGATTTWMADGAPASRVRFDDDGLNQAFRQSLLVIKNAQNPELGTVPAATNPFAYGHKTWVRDASITAIALDASGHTGEAELYWRWMAGVQGSDGSWKTTYSAWDGSYLSFVEPENDSIGTFLYGVCRHYVLTGDSVFLRDLWPAVQRAADFVLNRLASNGFGPADYSIWEEVDRGLEHNTYTQSWYVLGFYAVQKLAELRGDTGLADWYAGGAASIMTAFQRPDDASPPGMWNAKGGYFNRAVRIDNTVQNLIDSSSNVIAAFGVVDAGSGRARAHVAKTSTTLACSQWGLSRYLGDDYYYKNPFSPAGDEVEARSPAWPQMSMWVAAFEKTTGSPSALSRLQWFASTMGALYTPQGEAVSNVTHQSVLSSMCEPLTASSFVLAALYLQGEAVLSLIPPIHNAGAFKPLALTFGTEGDFPQWSNVPYFVPAPPTSAKATPQTTASRVYLANDDLFLYVRIDNAAGSLPLYRAQPVFAVRVYSGDFAGGGSPPAKVAADGGSLPRAASFMVERQSDSEDYERWAVTSGVWSPVGSVKDAMAPQWDASLGRIEMAIPLASLSSTSPSAPAWAHLCVVLATVTPEGSVAEVHRSAFHYRWSTANQPWIYGNIEF